MKILITYATRALAIRIANLLSPLHEIVLATSEDIPSVFQAKYRRIPTGVNPVFSHELLKLALDEGCDYILPLGGSEIQSLAESLVLFEEYGVHVLCPAKDQLEEIEVLFNPTKDMVLSLSFDGKDLLTGAETLVDITGLGLVSDSGESFVLAALN